MKRIKQCPKMFVCVSLLGLVLVLGLIQEGGTHNHLDDFKEEGTTTNLLSTRAEAAKRFLKTEN